MNDLRLPEQLKGRWENALILTYGFDAPFFENALWSQFGARCRNKITLVDGQRYLQASGHYAQSGLVRYLNHRYVAEGIFCRQAAHAKLILLTNGEQGRLLIGSGNLNMQGYASGGELFTRYEYGPEATDSLPAFLAVRELIEGMMAAGYVRGTAVRYINLLLENSPWLYQASDTDWRPVRHNLEQSFLDQLVAAAGDEPVEALWVLSPFYDEKVIALQEIMARLQPQHTTLLVQPGYTSVDPAALQVVWQNGRCQVRPFSKVVDDRGTNPYVHAKMLLLQLSNRAICLHGSPNLSQVAMLLTPPHGNIELANLLTGARDSFDDILDGLTIEPAVLTLSAIELSYQGSNGAQHPTVDGWYLTDGEWQNKYLHLRYRGPLPDLEGAVLVIAERPFPIRLIRQQAEQLTIQLDEEAIALLARPVPVLLRWPHEHVEHESNVLFVCHRTLLDSTVSAEDEGENLDHLGQLDLEDDEFEQLLHELERTLILDERDVWQLARQPGSSSPASHDQEDATPVNYDDINYEVLRQHPRIRQYIERGVRDSHRHSRSRLQIILSSITNHFRGLLDVADEGQSLEEIISTLAESDAQTEAEREQEEAEKQRRKQSSAQRVRHMLRNFVRRYIHGISNARFQEFAGHEVMSQNYVIFDHLLWKLFQRDWVEDEFVVESLLRTWSLFWGSDHQLVGYYQNLPVEPQSEVMAIVRTYHGVSRLLAGLFYSSRLPLTDKTRLALRDFWRYLLVDLPLVIDEELLAETWTIVAEVFVYEPPRPTEIVNTLQALAEFQTESGFLRLLEEKGGYPSGSCYFDSKVKVRRRVNQRFVDDTVKGLFVRKFEKQPTAEDAILLLREWIRYEKEREYYRVSFTNPEGKLQVLFFDVPGKDGVYWNEVTGGEEAFTHIAPIDRPWDVILEDMANLASQVNEKSIFANVHTEKANLLSS